MNLFRIALVGVTLTLANSEMPVRGEPCKWDYTRHPIKVLSETAAPLDTLVGVRAESAFDGFGAQGSRPGAGWFWHQITLPTPEKPYVVELDYGQPADVSAFVNYFYVPDGLDYRPFSAGWSAN